jgi:hypothetical protein
MLTLRADDRVLLLAIPPVLDLATMARVLMAGSVVALGTSEEVDNARREMAEFDNVLFLEASPERIPWRDQFFTKVVVPPHLERLLPEISNEIHRLLAPGGTIVSSGVDV